MSNKKNGFIHRIVWLCAFLYLAVEAYATIGATFPGQGNGDWYNTLGEYAEIPGWIMIAIIMIRQEVRRWISKELTHKDAEELCIMWFEFIVLLLVIGHFAAVQITWSKSTIDTSVFLVTAFMTGRISRWINGLKALVHAKC